VRTCSLDGAAGPLNAARTSCQRCGSSCAAERASKPARSSPAAPAPSACAAGPMPTGTPCALSSARAPHASHSMPLAASSAIEICRHV
jgi:hypothetical protein